MPSGFVPSLTFSNKKKEDQKEEWGFKKDDIVIGHIGEWGLYKNSLALKEAIESLPENFKGVYITETKDERIKLLSSRIRLDNKNETADCLRGIDVLLMPSIKEGFGQILIEAWATGVPVVSTSVGVFKDMWAMYGFPFGQVIKHNDSGDKIARAIKSALEMEPEKILDIKGHALYRFNGITVSKRWHDYLKSTSEMYWQNAILLKLKQRVEIMVSKSTPKKVARQLNMEEVPVQDGTEEWTYKNVLDFIASS